MKINNREIQFPLNKIFPKRWSPRSFNGKKLTKTQIMTLFEAARWSPSAFNGQPWKFVYTERGDKNWKRLLNLLIPFNQMWVKNSSLLVFVISNKKFEYNGKSNKTHSFDVGAAWMSVALQASLMGLAAHGMSGINYKKATEVLKIPKNYKLEMAFAVGKKDLKSKLPADFQKMEVQSDRNKVNKFISKGTFVWK
ncbi:nitroreductase family protein [Candidatus Woesearchaeota archaeon]|jgi:nitroreductase|nr:nitroreductase family protein [Candidatus Woesearchaeota archaeon]MBT4336044.1 nitroreductase family protein [Candidatus Woesearchaeota archaeon]MBT4468977.1 nitroreductase family protein [Candidatus Woesearchaeota archaeon]MBT6744704.1 nitroreductase family protein [Candidatus Woesearchaeota archaeon]